MSLTQDMHTVQCIDIDALCIRYRLNVDSVMDAVASSHVSFGNNDMTLIALSTLKDILDRAGITHNLTGFPEGAYISMPC